MKWFVVPDYFKQRTDMDDVSSMKKHMMASTGPIFIGLG